VERVLLRWVGDASVPITGHDDGCATIPEMEVTIGRGDVVDAAVKRDVAFCSADVAVVVEEDERATLGRAERQPWRTFQVVEPALQLGNFSGNRRR
jgi:hypothetical protein